MTTDPNMTTNAPIRKPTTTDELAAFVRDAAQNQQRVIINGSSSQPFAASSQSDSRPLCRISTQRYNKVVEQSIPDMTITVQAGMTLSQLQQHLGWQNQWLPIDPPAIGGRDPMHRTIGGLIATNSLGPLRFAAGDECDWRMMTLGMKFIDGGGTLIRAGGKTVKNVAGYAMHRLLIGSQGTLGAIAEVTLRTYARPVDEQSLLIFCSSPSQAEDILAIVQNSDILPAYIQAIGNQTFIGNPVDLPSAAIVLHIGFLGQPAICAAQVNRLRELNTISTLNHIAQSASPSARLRLWMTREPAGACPFRMYVTSSQVTQVLAEIESAAEQHVFAVAEAGSGQIRGVLCDLSDDIQHQTIAAINHIAAAHQGVIQWVNQPQTMPALYARMKSALDPASLYPQFSVGTTEGAAV